MLNIIIKVLKKATKWSLGILSFLSLSYFFSLLSNVHGSDIPESYFREGVPPIIGLLDSAFFMGVIFVITLSVMIYVVYLLWQLHEVAVHRVDRIKSKQAKLVFALSLCGLFLHKAWWVLAVIIAFTDWVAITTTLSNIISSGLKNSKEETA